MRSANWSRVVLPEAWQSGGFGLYIHWPFCMAKCPYCDFNSHVSSLINQKDWLAAYLSEIDRVGEETQGRVLGSVFFGGGTPSLMDPDVVAAIIERVKATWPIVNDIEITLEANPTSVEAGRFRGYREGGVNRVSLGVQALNDNDLKRLGRLHSVSEALDALQIARDTFDRVSFDLIYARQDQSLAHWKAELAQALTFQPDHLSMYQLTIEDGTAFGDRYARGLLKGLPDEDLGADMYDATQSLCDAAGLPAYEVSNHAKPGSESRHNLIYWQSGDFLGIGPGAHGRVTFGGTRYATDTELQPGKWLASVRNGGSGEKSRVELSDTDCVSEFLMMGLRLADGVSLDRIEVSDQLAQKISCLVEEGLLVQSDENLKTTARGRSILNAVVRELLPD